ncbi:hypothetical protein DL98DRAFT_179430 [Cadophora sp. DSE1049]|nr:hypothetical protein DL98DRAFT_179430 [Cadophora sp. DSE1049]
MKKREVHYPKHIYRHFVIEDPRSSYRHGTLPVMFESDYHVDWPQEFFTSPEEQGWSVHRLARVLRRHVRKNKKTYHSAFVSSSGNIYWSVYRTGQRSRKLSSTQIACMAVFDMQEILNGGQTVLWYLPDLMEYLDPQKRFFSHDDRKWAQNNQEYITWAFLPMDALVYWSTWEELTSPGIGFLQERRPYWFTLALFESRTTPTPITVEEYIEKIVKFAEQCGGGRR